MQSVPIDFPYHNVIMECNLTYFGVLDFGLNPVSNFLIDLAYSSKLVGTYLSKHRVEKIQWGQNKLR